MMSLIPFAPFFPYYFNLRALDEPCHADVLLRIANSRLM